MNLRKMMVKVKFKKNKILQLFLSFLGAVVIFIGVLYMQKQLLAPNGMSQIIVAKTDIKENQLITDKNYNEFFEYIDRDSLLISKNTVTSEDDIINHVVKDVVIKGNGISKENLLDKDSLLLKLDNPVEFTLMASDIGQVVGGLVREGDIINIGVVNETTKEYEEAKSYAYVDKTLRSDGTLIDRAEEGTAVAINIIASKDDKAVIESKIATGKLVISRVKDFSSIDK